MLAVIGLSASCGNVVRQGRAPVYLVIDQLQSVAGGSTAGTPSAFLLSDVLGSRTSPAPCTSTAPCPTVFDDSGTVALRLSLKDLGTATSPTTASTNNEVTINRYHVTYRRADGRNTPGVDVPYGFDGAVTGTVPAGGNMSLGFELVRHAAKEEAPLMQLVYNANTITTIADVTFYGRDQVGNDVSVTGSIQVDFGNFGDR
jgi:hypothetical protein